MNLPEFNADLLLVVPATANILAKFASGIADDFLSSTYLAAKINAAKDRLLKKAKR